MNTRKKWLAVLLSFCMILALIPSMAFAAGTDNKTDISVASVTTSNGTQYYETVAAALDDAKLLTTDDISVEIFKSCAVEAINFDKAATLTIDSGVTLYVRNSNFIGSSVRVVNNGTINLEGTLDLSNMGIATTDTSAGLVLNQSGKINLAATALIKMNDWFSDWSRIPGDSDCIFSTVADGAQLQIGAAGTPIAYGTPAWPKQEAKINTTKYDTLTDAVNYAKENASAPIQIDVIQNTSNGISLDSNAYNIIVDATGKTVSGAISVGKTTDAKGILELKNGTFSGGITVDGGDVVIDNGTYTNTVQLASGSLTIKGGDFTGANVTMATGKAITIEAGKFSFDPTLYKAANSVVTDNEDGTWTVTKPTKTLANATVTGLQSAYVGSTTTAVKPTDFVVKDGTTTLVKDKDYTVSYGTNILVGTATTATGYIYFTGKGDYAGTSTSASFKIVKTARSMSYATVAKIADQKYSSTIGVYGATPAVTVTWKDSTMITPITLVQGEDYTVTYSNNKAIGTASVTVKGIGAYSGYAYGSFEITGNLDLGLTVISSIPDQKYTGYDVKPSLTVKYGSTYLYEGTDYTATYSSNKYVGTGRVTITGKGKYTGTNTATFKIKYDLAGATVTPSATTLKWNGAAQAPTVTVKYGTTALTAGTDYVLSSTAYNKNCGTYTVTVSAVSTSSKAMGSTSFTYTIDGTDQSITGVSSTYKKTTYTESFKLKPDAVDATGFTYTSADPDVATVSSDGTVTIKSIGTTTITISTVGNTKYNPAVKKVNLIVNPRAGYLKSVTSPSKGKLTFKYYKRPGGISGVQVRYSRYSDFRSYGTKTIVTTNTKDYSVIGTKSYTGFKSGRVLYVKTRNYKKLDDGTKLYGAWSTVKKVVVK